MKDFFGALTPGLAKTNMTDGYSSMVLTVVTMCIGLFVIIILAHKGVNGALLFGMLAACVVYWAGEALSLIHILRSLALHLERHFLPLQESM